MEFRDFLGLLNQNKKIIVFTVILFVAGATAVVMTTPLRYKAESRLLIVQDFSTKASSYSITQSNDYISKLLARVVNSSSFFKDVANSGYNIDTGYFSPTGNSVEMARTWKNTVEANATAENGGTLDITVYHTDKEQLRQIAEAVNHVLVTNHQKYHSLDERLEVKIIDFLTTSEFPVKPNVFYIFAVSLVLGVITGSSYVYLFRAPREERRLPESGGLQEGSVPSQEPRVYTEYADKEIETKRERSEQESDNVFEYGQQQEYITIKQQDQEEFLKGEEESRPESPQPEKEVTEEESGERKQETPEEEKDEDDADGHIPPEEIEKKGDIRNIFG